MPIQIDQQNAPLLHVRFTGTITDEQIDEYITWYRGVLEKAARDRRPVGFVIDSGTSTGLSSKQRQRILDTDKSSRPHFVSSRSCMAVVNRNAVQRGVFTALSWFISFPDGVKIFEAASDATEWVKKNLNEPPRSVSGRA
jgi:hypothetical protein